MKFKKITQKALPVIFSIVLAVGTSIAGAGAIEDKTYLKDMDYPTIETNLNSENSYNYSYTEYDNHFYTSGKAGTVKCTDAMKLSYSDYSKRDYEENANFASYKITYNLNSNFDEFNTSLFTDSPEKIDCEFLGDNERIVLKSFTRNTDIINLQLDVTGIDTLSIKVTSAFEGWDKSIIFNNAYLTTGEVIEDPTNPTNEPTEPIVIPTQPTNEPTSPTIEPTNPTTTPTHKPTEKPTQAPTDEATDEPTDKPTQTPTSSPTNPTTPTEKTTNKPTSTNTITNNTATGKTAGAINTGDTSFIILAVLIIGIASSAVFITRKIKHSK
ncbi:MAG: PT domain-containing protein [Acutalibacteraceae bacterium]|nr:PT domain-containing protein [Acutalibacteraceae bacterium]